MLIAWNFVGSEVVKGELMDSCQMPLRLAGAKIGDPSCRPGPRVRIGKF